LNVAVSLANPSLAKWKEFKVKYNKSYQSAEEEGMRYQVFLANLAQAEKVQARSPAARYGVTKFSDMTPAEFKNKYLMNVTFDKNNLPKAPVWTPPQNVQQLPSYFDWTDKGVVTAVKNQEQCGSCWAFSTTGVLEGHYAIKNGKLLSFSEQQIVDCDTDCYGCGGGWPYLALEYTGANGIEQESTYPYTGVDGTCNYKKAETVSANTGYSFVTPNNANDLLTAIVSSPVSVAIEADQSVFQFYTSGVISTGCGDTIDHAVLAVGYTTVNGKQAYIVKNSWGESWGDQGYVYISTDAKPNGGEGVCGILYQPVVPK